MSLSATPSKIVLYPGNTQGIQITGLQDAITGAYLNAASVTATLVDSQGNPVPELDEITFNYIPGSNGNYLGVFGDVDFEPAVGTSYTLLIDATQSDNTMHLEMLVEIQPRQQ